MKKFFKWLIIIILFFALAVIFIVPKSLSLVKGGDDPLNNDSDLLVEKISISELDNSYFDLIKIPDVISKDQVTHDAVNDFVFNKTNLSLLTLEQYFKTNRDALNLVTIAASKRTFQDPQYAEVKGYTTDAPIIDLSSWRKAARLSAAKSISLIKTNKDKEAFEEVLKLIKIGYVIQNSQTNTITYLVGVAINDLGLIVIEDLIDSTSLKPNELAFYKNELSKYPVVTNNSFLKGEYLIFKNAIGDNFLKLAPEFYELDKIADNNFYLKPNKTINLRAEFINKLIKHSEAACDSIMSDVILNDLKFYEIENKIKFYITENSVGKLLATMDIASLSNIKDKRCALENKFKSVLNKFPTNTLNNNIDSDSDGLSDIDEQKYGTNINNPDSDNDGFNDGEEIRNGYNPLGEGILKS